ncbi:MAG: TnsA endonuclease N-terminal domain-containing protein [Gallionella sp.]|nr:TnsA endonuclease N-terminal domain-containing protein [Gallionella sp.]
MPVRKIPKNYMSSTGVFSSQKNGRSLGCESLLERDLMILLEFDDTVERFEEQPVKISFRINGKSRRSYVPDILIHYLPSPTGETPHPVLGEVKHTDHLKKHRAKYKPKFEAAARYAEEHGWEWRIFTQKEIRTPYLDNLKFLREYHSSDPDIALQHEVISYLQNARSPVTVESLLNKLCSTDDRTLRISPAIWHLVATKCIVTNLQKPLGIKNKLSLSKEVIS